MKTMLLLLACTLPAWGLSAQKLTVIAAKGQTTAHPKGQSGQKTKLYSGKKVPEGQVIEVGHEGYLGLMLPGGNSLELKPGTYQSTQLLASAKDKKSVTEQYADYVISQAKEEDQNYHQKMEHTGAVFRATANPSNLKVRWPQASKTLPKEPLLAVWYSQGPKAEYRVKLVNMYEETLFNETTQDTSLTIPAKAYKGEERIFLTVKATLEDGKVLKSEKHTVKALSNSEEKSLKAARKQLPSEPENAIDCLLLAGFYQKQGLFHQAHQMHLQAQKKRPEVPAYHQAYEQFLENQSR